MASLTEGTDVPDIDTVFLTRQTTSQILMTQMIGRALRGPTFGGTEKANIVLFVDDWKQKIHWATYDQFGAGEADDKCLCCGSSRFLQVDHIVPSFKGGGNLLDNLQILCGTCNRYKGVADGIDFRIHKTPLTVVPARLLQQVPPTGSRASDPAEWEQFLRRAINFFFQCAAVDTLTTQNSDGNAITWSVSILRGNDPEWFRLQLNGLTQEIRDFREELGFAKGPLHITLNQAESDFHRPLTVQTAGVQTTLKTVLAAVEQVEGFQVRLTYPDGRQVRGDLTKDIEPYRYKNAFRGGKTLDAWKSARFFSSYPIFDDSSYRVQILDADGHPCAGQTKMRTVRETYKQ